MPEEQLSEKEVSLPSSEIRSTVKVVGTSDEFVITRSLLAVLPTSSEPKLNSLWSIIRNGYFVIAYSLIVEISSTAPSLSLIVRAATITLAISHS